MSVVEAKVYKEAVKMGEVETSSLPPKFPKNDPVAANLSKVIQILNKHNLTEGLDLRYLRDSVGIESGAGRKIKADPHLNKPEKTDPDKEPDLPVRLRRGRKVPVLIDNDGSYLGTFTKSGKDECKDTDAPSITDLVNDNPGIPTEIGDFSDVRGTSSRLSGLDINLEKELKKSGDLDLKNRGLATKTAMSDLGNMRKYKKDTCVEVKSLDVQRVLDTLGSGPEVKDIPRCSDSASGSSLSAASGDLKPEKFPSLNTDKDVNLTDDLPGVAIDGCYGNTCHNINNHGNKDLLSDTEVKVDPVDSCASPKDVILSDVPTVAPPTAKSGVEQFRVFYWKIEMEEWTRVNRQLRQHGLPQVELMHPRKAAETSDIVMLDPETAQTLRHTLQTLMKDCDRRQELVQELILTNNQLSCPNSDDERNRRELGEQTLSTEKYESKARELKAQLDTSRTHIEDLEEDRLLHGMPAGSEEEKLRNTKNAVQVKCQELQKKVDEQSLAISKLQAELEHMKIEEKRLKEKHEEAYSRLKKQLPRNAHIDDKTLDVIDSYERQIYSLRKQLEEQDNKNAESSFEEATPNYKALIKSYEREVREAKKKIKTLENENQILTLDLQSRPDLKSYRATQHKVKKLERMLKKNNINPAAGYPDKDHLAYSTRLEDLDYLPASHCQTHLRQVCSALDVNDLEEIRPTLHQHLRALDAQPRLIEFARDVLDIVNTPGLPVPPEYTNRSLPNHTHEVWCEKTWHHVIPTLRYWCTQMAALKDLQEGLVKLSCMFAPDGSTGLDSNPPSVVKMVTAVRGLLSDEPARNSQSSKGGSKERPSRSVLQGIVDHFMTLFDVTKISGVYARMNDLYTKLGEVHNMMKTLRNLLGLAEESRGSAVVDAVARLCRTHTETTTEHIKQLLKVEDLDSVIRKLEEHEEFFPAFQEIMSKLMEICNCHRLDQLVPTVRALKLLAG